jgi:uncharacterized protein YecE (DUF72 family)
MLDYYRNSFDTVEINNSFYRLPPETAVAGWQDTTPGNFCFAMKGSRFLTHMKKLKDPGAGLERFFQRADLLGDKLGAVLWQLPPQWEVDLDRLREFLDALPKHVRHAFEFRNPTWEAEPVYNLLGQFNAAQCAFHLAGYQSPIVLTADFTYVRLHGPGAKYQGSYSDAALQEWADRITKWRRSLKAVYVYFDNDHLGYAPVDALRLRGMLEK